jgi:uncharacterized protein (TIGR02246 family)
MRIAIAAATVSCLAVPSFFAWAADESGTTNDIVAACEQLVIQYAGARDTMDREGFVGTFTQDGVLILGSQHLEGRDAIREQTNNWPENDVARHLMTNIDITPVDETTATGISYVLVIGDEREEGATGPMTVSGFRMMGEYHDEFRLTDDGWKISRRELSVTFIGARRE